MIRINLLAAERPTQKKQKAERAPGALQLYLFLFLFAGGAVALCGFGWFLQEAKLRDLAADIDAATKRKADLKTVADKVEEMQAREQTFRDKVNLIKKLQAQQSAPVHMLDEISKALPDFVWLTNMTQNGASLTMAGESSTLTAMADFITALQEAGPECGQPNPADRSKCWFPDVNLTSSTSRSENLVTFNLTATYRSLEEAAQQAAAAAAAAGQP